MPQPVNEMARRTLVDWALALRRVGGDRALLRELVQIMIAELPGWLRDLGQAVVREQGTEIRRLAHTIKGALGQIGALAAQEKALGLETLGKDNNLTGTPRAWRELEQEIECLQPLLAEFLGNTGSKA